MRKLTIAAIALTAFVAIPVLADAACPPNMQPNPFSGGCQVNPFYVPPGSNAAQAAAIAAAQQTVDEDAAATDFDDPAEHAGTSCPAAASLSKPRPDEQSESKWDQPVPVNSGLCGGGFHVRAGAGL
jgi:hypothetical protein